MTKINRQDYITAEMKPDIYDGEKCDQIRPRWWAYADGDMDGDFINTLDFDAKQFPAGTMVVLSLPVCPKCDQTVELCEHDDHCDFDWEEWVQNEYS